jgi:hypothetical protein
MKGIEENSCALQLKNFVSRACKINPLNCRAIALSQMKHGNLANTEKDGTGSVCGVSSMQPSFFGKTHTLSYLAHQLLPYSLLELRSSGSVISSVKLDAEPVTTDGLGGHKRRARTSERIEHQTAGR